MGIEVIKTGANGQPVAIEVTNIKGEVITFYAISNGELSTERKRTGELIYEHAKELRLSSYSLDYILNEQDKIISSDTTNESKISGIRELLHIAKAKRTFSTDALSIELGLAMVWWYVEGEDSKMLNENIAAQKIDFIRSVPDAIDFFLRTMLEKYPTSMLLYATDSQIASIQTIRTLEE